MKNVYLNNAVRAALLAVAAFLFVCNALTLSTWTQQTDPAAAGELGIRTAPGLVDKRLRLTRVDPQGALARAGAKIGDLIVFAHPGTGLRQTFSLTEVVDLTLYADGQARHLRVHPLPPQNGEGLQSPLNATLRLLTAFFAIALAVVIVLRKGDDGAMLAFAASLLANAPSTFTLYLPAGALQDFAAIVVRPMDYVCGYLFFLLFALKFPSENAYFKRRHVPAAFFTMGALIVVSAVLHLSASRGLIHLTPASNELLSVVRRSCGIVSAICSLALLGYSWRTSQGTMRTRIGWVLPSIGISYVVWSAYLALDQMGLPLRSDLASYGNNVAAFVGYAGFSYALLRHKVFTFGFAINRALVYTLISTMVLVAFGITEFAVDKLLHFEGRQKNIIFDAIVALLIILSFHRIQHWSAEKVDHTFFHRWYDAAEKLRRFVEQSAHITSAEVLRERFADAFEVFATSAGVATYAAGVDGSFTLRHTTLPAAPAHIDVDHPLAVALRHRPQAVQLEELAAGLPGALALPMTLRGALAGIILMAGKNSQQAFRPDEVSLMESSAHSLAVQLDGVRVQELQKFAASLQGRQSELESKLALVEREANDLRTGNLDLREANVALRTLAGIG